MSDLYGAALGDITGSYDHPPYDASPMQVQNILRHAMAEVIGNEIVNVLIVTNSPEATPSSRGFTNTCSPETPS